MKKKDVPQDKGPLKDVSREVVYAVSDDGKIEKTLSEGWDVKKEALDNAWKELNEAIEEAKALVLQGQKSPIFFFMAKNIMDVKVLSAYVELSRRKVKKHLLPRGFRKLTHEQLEKYAHAFEITVDELRNFPT